MVRGPGILFRMFKCPRPLSDTIRVTKKRFRTFECVRYPLEGLSVNNDTVALFETPRCCGCAPALPPQSGLVGAGISNSITSCEM